MRSNEHIRALLRAVIGGARDDRVSRISLLAIASCMVCRWNTAVTLLIVLLSLSSHLFAQGDLWVAEATNYNFRHGVGAPAHRTNYAYCWTGTHLVVWGGANGGTRWNIGHLYNPVTDTWESKPNLNSGLGAPTPRQSAGIVAASGKLVVFGGHISGGPSGAIEVNTGGVYDIATDTWLSTPNLSNGTGVGVPSPRYFGDLLGPQGVMEWTGTNVIVFGGTYTHPSGFPAGRFDGGAYNISTDQWEARPGLNTPVADPKFCGPGLWTGSKIICRAGDGGVATITPSGTFLSAGDVYDPVLDVWESPFHFRNGTLGQAKGEQLSAWTGEWYLEFGGEHDFPITVSVSPPVTVGITPINSGLCYDVDGATFGARPSFEGAIGGPTIRYLPRAFWSGASFIVWAGGSLHYVGSGPYLMADVFTDGWVYDAVLDSWTPLSGMSNGSNAPPARHTSAVTWTGDRLLVWGGYEGPQSPGAVAVNTGAVYVPPRVAPTIRSGQVEHALQANTFFRHRVTVYGCPRASVGVMGMPSWMTQKWLDTGCFLEGTPNAQEAMQTSVITITADNGIGTFDMQTIKIGPPTAPVIDTIPTLQAEVGKRFEFRIPAGGPPYPTLTATGMPSWMSIVSGRIEGYPQPADANTTATITMTADNGVGLPATRQFTINVIPAIPPGGTVPGILMPGQASAIAGEPFAISALLSGTPHPLLSSQNLPAWLSISGDLLFGTPPLSTSNTTANITLTASNNVPPAATHGLQIAIAHNPRDVNRDLSIDVVDVQRIVNLILNLATPAYTAEGDANNDTAVDVIDAQLVVNRILNP